MTVYCAECGVENADIAKFCKSCGKLVRPDPNNPVMNQPVQNYQQPVQGQAYQPVGYIPPQNAPPGYTPYYRPRLIDYIRPENYVFTKTVWERIRGTLLLNVDVVEEIEERLELQKEAVRVLNAAFTVIAVFRFILLFVSPAYEVISIVGSFLRIFFETFGGGYIFMVTTAYIGKQMGGRDTKIDSQEIFRVLGYAYVALAITAVIRVFAFISVSFNLLWFVMLVYSGIVIAFAIRRALDTGWVVPIFTVFITLIIRGIAVAIFASIIDSIFGGTWNIVT